MVSFDISAVSIEIMIFVFFSDCRRTPQSLSICVYDDTSFFKKINKRMIQLPILETLLNK